MGRSMSTVTSNRVVRGRVCALAASQQPAVVATGSEPTTAVAWKTIPSWYLVATADRTIGTENLRFMAKRAGSTTVEVDAAAQRSEQVDGLAAGHTRPQGDVAGHVGQAAVKGHDVAPGVAAEQTHLAGVRLGSGTDHLDARRLRLLDQAHAHRARRAVDEDHVAGLRADGVQRLGGGVPAQR